MVVPSFSVNIRKQMKVDKLDKHVNIYVRKWCFLLVLNLIKQTIKQNEIKVKKIEVQKKISLLIKEILLFLGKCFFFFCFLLNDWKGY